MHNCLQVSLLRVRAGSASPRISSFFFFPLLPYALQHFEVGAKCVLELIIAAALLLGLTQTGIRKLNGGVDVPESIVRLHQLRIVLLELELEPFLLHEPQELAP